MGPCAVARGVVTDMRDLLACLRGQFLRVAMLRNGMIGSGTPTRSSLFPVGLVAFDVGALLGCMCFLWIRRRGQAQRGACARLSVWMRLREAKGYPTASSRMVWPRRSVSASRCLPALPSLGLLRLGDAHGVWGDASGAVV